MSGDADIDLLLLVPARGGSKGLPRKNALALGEWPLLRWTAEAVRAAAVPGSLALLSTDDDELAGIGRAAGLEVPFRRPQDLAHDTAGAWPVAEHALDWLARERGLRPRWLMLLQPTSPLRQPGRIAEAAHRLRSGSAAAVLGVKPIHRSPETLFHADDRGILSALAPSRPGVAARRQDTRTLYTPNGALYALPVEALRQARGFFVPQMQALVMDAIESIDIDDQGDLALAAAAVRAGLSWRGAGNGA